MLGPEAERRLAAQLIRTLKEAEAAIAQAWSTGDRARLSRLGHALKGNSGAHYFGLSAIREAGAALEAAFRPAAGRSDPTAGEAPRTAGPDPSAHVAAASAGESGAGGSSGPEAGEQAVDAARQAIAAAIAALRERFPAPEPDER
ncbi:Hpt domain-containing protein [Hydrogenibacillus schlegelii]|uniref:HPt domain-containing protein n=1 Tax=Hydrogenibacillus schlegelii TaxID=1484 RepID=A0A179IU30_HYDSH|nr:Hpt domain-containing protein [Hydrogenibacillus schlegelii]OAR05024.1 hypothetical protein SA87_05850 [Hydrogenibacillus schlegelii]